MIGYYAYFTTIKNTVKQGQKRGKLPVLFLYRWITYSDTAQISLIIEAFPIIPGRLSQYSQPLLTYHDYGIYHSIFLSFFFLGLRLWHIEVLGLGAGSELQLPYVAARAMWDPSCICNLHRSSRQHGFLNPLSKARDWTRILMYTSS